MAQSQWTSSYTFRLRDFYKKPKTSKILKAFLEPYLEALEGIVLHVLFCRFSDRLIVGQFIKLCLTVKLLPRQFINPCVLKEKGRSI